MMRVRQKQVTVEAICWTNNEPEIRAFVMDDTRLRFMDDGLLVWNDQDMSWIKCPMFHFIVKDRRGNLLPYSPEGFKENFEELT